MLDQLTYDDLKALEGTSFWVYPEQDHKVELRVVQVAKVMESEAARLTRAAFSVFFVGPKSYALQQRIYPMVHEKFPEPLMIFVVPVKEDEATYLYEAVFT